LKHLQSVLKKLNNIDNCELSVSIKFHVRHNKTKYSDVNSELWGHDT
jgi:hypothetical protein